MPHHLSSPRLRVACPSCAQPAEIVDRFTLDGTHAIQHLKVRCPSGHWYTLPADRVRPHAVRRAELAA